MGGLARPKREREQADEPLACGGEVDGEEPLPLRLGEREQRGVSEKSRGPRRKGWYRIRRQNAACLLLVAARLLWGASRTRVRKKGGKTLAR